MRSKERAEYALVHGHELIVWHAAEHEVGEQLPRYGWKLYSGPGLGTVVASGAAASYHAAKTAVEAAWRARADLSA
jgi:hypothetical protein